MFDWVDTLMDKIRPDLARDTHRRTQETNEVVKKTEDARRDSTNAIFEAYRQSGVAVASNRSGHRKWED